MPTCFKTYVNMFLCGVLLVSCAVLSSCAKSGDGASKYGNVQTGDASVTIGPIGPLVGIGDSVVRAAQASAEAYLKSLNVPMKELNPDQIKTAADKAVQAADREAVNNQKPLAQDERDNIRKAVVNNLNARAL